MITKSLLPRSAVLLAALTLLTSAVAAERPGLMLGSAWYPEQWPEAQWDHDLTLMHQAGFNIVRIGEFAWSSLEPSEGHYDLDWMERAINAAAAHHLKVIIGTPTDTPPAWLTTKYPETLRVDKTGRQLHHGDRRQFSYSSPKYRELCRQIVEQLARRFGHHPDVMAWQIDNEYTEDSYDPSAVSQWHQWLQARYHTIAELNQKWTTAYWSQTYDAWDEIPMGVGRQNPGLLLDYMRFVTDTWRSFQHNQLEVLRREVDPRQLITTNLGGLGWANRFNRQVIASDLDVISWDEYLGAGWFDDSKNGTGHLDPLRSGSTHDLVRGWKQQNYWVMEMPPGFVDWSPVVSNCLDQGETRAMTWHAVGHGADLVAYWQWRSALNGQEQYHGSLVGADGEPVPVYAEIAQTGAEFAKAGPVLAGTSPVSQVALIHDYDSRWAIEFTPFSHQYDQMKILEDYYRVLRAPTQAVDIVVPTVDLSRYKLVVAPNLNVISSALAKHLTEYVEQGGHLVLGPRSGMKDGFNALNRERQPGPLVPVLGGRVEQYYALLKGVPIAGAWGTGEVTLWAERLDHLAPDVKVRMRYGAGNDWLTDQPAAIERKVGKGTITYLGAVLDPALMASTAQQWIKEAGVDSPVIPAPDRVSVCRRVGAGREVYVITNFSAGAQDIALPGPMTDVLNGGETSRLHLPRYGVSILTRPLR